MPQIALPGLSLHYQCQGKGPAVLLVHGLGSCADDWEHQVAALKDSYEVISVDLRGHGQSAKSLDDHSMQAMAEDLAHLIRELDTGPVAAVGISMGGVVVLQLAAAHPGLVHSAVVVNSAPEALPDAASGMMLATRSLMVRFMGLRRFGAVLANKLFPHPQHAAERETFVRRFSANNQRKPYLASMKAVLTFKAGYDPASLTLPILMIAGDQDYTPVSYKKQWAERLPNAGLRIVEGAHHALPVEYPDRFNDILLTFLTQQRRRMRG